jgi:tight adherence protein C
MFFPQYLSYALVAVGIFTAYMALVNLFGKDRSKLRTEQISDVLPDQDGESHGIVTIMLKHILVLFGIDLGKQHDSILQLAKAGYSTQASLIHFLFFKRFIQPVILAVGIFLLVKIFVIDGDGVKKHLALLISAILLVITGAYGATLFLSNQATKRSQELIRTFPEALDLILICVESGLGIDAAFARVCKEMKDSHPVVAAEFERTRFEMTMMSDRVQALQNFGDRVGVGAVRTLVSSLIQAERFGTSLVDTMRMIAEEQRSDRMMRAEERAARLPALITLPLILFILPALFMIILGPAVVRLNEQGGIFGNANK